MKFAPDERADANRRHFQSGNIPERVSIIQRHRTNRTHGRQVQPFDALKEGNYYDCADYPKLTGQQE
jgi:hypothetical protein